MKDKTNDYEKVVKELVKDPESYANWSLKDDEADEIRNALNETIWREQ